MIAAVILAAGRSTRLGLPKAVLPAGPGETLLSRAIRVARASVDGPVIPVLGGDAGLSLAELDRLDDPRVAPVVNSRFALGLSTSLQAGLDDAATADGVLVLLADQPGVETAQASQLVERFRRRAAPIEAVTASMGSEQRPPVVLGHALFGAVAGLRGDEGARRILRSRPDQVLRVEWGDGPWAIDLDTWEDYASFAHRQGWHLEVPPGATPDSSESPAQNLAQFRRMVLAALNEGPRRAGA